MNVQKLCIVNSNIIHTDMALASKTKKSFLIAVIILFLIANITLCNAENSEEIIISDGSNLIKFSIERRQLIDPIKLLNSDKWSYATWPSFNRHSNLIYIQGQNKDFGLNQYIFSFSIKPFGENITKITKGFYPSISDNGKLLSYYMHPNQLRLIDLETSKNRLLISNIAKGQPAVWLDDHTLLYSDTENRMMKINIFTSKTENTGHDFIIPGMISPNKDQVLCGNYFGDRICMYTVKKNQIKVLKKSRLLSFGTNFVWIGNSQKFLYTRQTFLNIIRLRESRSLFLYSSADMEDKLIKLFALFGGSAL